MDSHLWRLPRRFEPAAWVGAFVAALALLGAVALLDGRSDAQKSFILLYLLPVAVATWFGGSRAGLAACLLTAIVSGILLPLGGAGGTATGTLFWNLGTKFGVYLMLCALLTQVRAQHWAATRPSAPTTSDAAVASAEATVAAATTSAGATRAAAGERATTMTTSMPDTLATAPRGELTARVLHWPFGLALGSAAALAAVGWWISPAGDDTRVTRDDARGAATVVATALRTTGEGSPAAPSVPTAAALREELAALAEAVRASRDASRPVLLGSRDPAGPSCVTPVRTGELTDAHLNPTGDLDGGPGTSMATLYMIDRQSITSPLQDFNWHQGRLRTYLENRATQNRPAQRLAEALSERATRLSREADGWTALPPAPDHPVATSTSTSSFAGEAAAGTTAPVPALTFDDGRDWPSYCMMALGKAASAGDLAGAQRWAAELANASFSLLDLHRWLALVLENHLRALEFQRDCEPLFRSADAMLARYDPRTTISTFPAGVLSLNGLGNYYEVERQAERLFSTPPDRLDALRVEMTAGSRWMLPGVREAYLRLERSLSPENQRAWEEAARAPYEHSFLTNMLFRAQQSGALDHLATVLQRFDRAHPRATPPELMGALMYRGHAFGGLEWADRFQPQLLDSAAAEIPPELPDADAFMAACRWAFRQSSSSTYGATFTLRDALGSQRLDCVRATDMAGALFRNAGRTRFGNVRWCAETAGHSVAAYLGAATPVGAGDAGAGGGDVEGSDGAGGAGSLPRTLVADPLLPPDRPQVWPDCYFRDHKWPPAMTPQPAPHAVELYVRGLDSYLWAEGYIIRGPRAGWLTTARLPYFPRRSTAESGKVFAGPYPQ